MSIKILIDPGHGGNDPGTSGFGYVEKNLTLQTSFLLKEELQRCGFKVYMTREYDSNVELSKRGQMAVDLEVNALISIHFNAGGGTGFEAIYSLNDNSAHWIADRIFDEVSTVGINMRKVYSKESEIYPNSNYYAVLRACENIVPGVILESLFLDSEQDIQFLNQPNSLKRLAICYAKGICKAYGVDYVAESDVVTPAPEPAPSPAPPQGKSYTQNLGEQAIDELVAKGLLNNPDYWKAKDLEHENVPLWLFFEMTRRLTNYKNN